MPEYVSDTSEQCMLHIAEWRLHGYNDIFWKTLHYRVIPWTENPGFGRYTRARFLVPFAAFRAMGRIEERISIGSINLDV
jgi:hypothetical protein